MHNEGLKGEGAWCFQPILNWFRKMHIYLLISIHLGMTKEMELRISWNFLRTLDPGITINFKQDKWKDIHIYMHPSETVGFRGSASGKDPTCQYRRRKRCGFHPWVRKIPWMRAWYPIPVFLPRESHGQRSLVDYSPQGHRESDMTEVT